VKIALFHNLPAGGAKRALFEHARHLRERGHTLDGYVLSTANEEFLPLAPLCRQVYTYDLPPALQPSRLAQRLIYHGLTRPLWRLVGSAAHQTAQDYLAFHHQRLLLDTLEAVYTRIARDIDAKGYDWVYVHHCRLLLSSFLLRQLETPTVYFCQDTLRAAAEWSWDPPSGVTPSDQDALPETFWLRNFQGRRMTRAAHACLREVDRRNTANARSADLVLANSWYSSEAILRAMGVNTRLCYLGVDSDFFCPEEHTPGEKRVLSVGTFHPAKGHEFVLEAVAMIPEVRRPALHVIGHDIEVSKQGGATYARVLHQRAQTLGVTLTVSHEVSDEALRQAYRNAACVAVAPYLEPFGLIPLEAMACQTPVVGVSEGGVRETVQHGVTGLLTERDPEAFSAALERVLSDTRLARMLGENGRATVRSLWTWPRSTSTLENLASQLLNGAKTPIATTTAAAA